MNYTRPNDLDRDDTPEDWLNSALLFAGALGHLLKENEGVVVDVKGDVKITELLDEDIHKVIIYSKGEQINITSCEDDIPEGSMIWMHGPEELN